MTDVPTSRSTMLAVWTIAASVIASAALLVVSMVVAVIRWTVGIPGDWAVAAWIVGMLALTVGASWWIVGRGWRHRGR